MVRGFFFDGSTQALSTSKDKQVVFGCHARIHDLAFEAGVALVNQRRLDARGGRWRRVTARTSPPPR